MGSDVMAQGDHFALLKVNGWSWISTQGEYNSAKKSFTPSENCTLSDDEIDEYITYMNKIVKGKTAYSMQILKQDYYKHILKFKSDTSENAKNPE